MPISANKINSDLLHFDAIFSHATIGIVVTDSTGNINAINPFALKKFGYSKHELIGNKIDILIHQPLQNSHSELQEEDQGKPMNRRMGENLCLYARKKNGKEFPVEISLSNYKKSGKKYVMAFIVDISKREKTTKENIKLKQDLEATVEQRTRDLNNTMRQLENALKREKELGELKSRFVSMASHEFRTPLSTVLSSAYLIEKYTSTEDQSKRDKHLQRIVSSVNLLTETLDDFLNVDKIETGKIQARYSVFNIRELVNSIVEEFKITLKKQQEILYHHENKEEVFLDKSMLNHIIINLVSNASKFSSEGSSIKLKTICTDEYLILSVKDQGIGIPKEDQVHLMERFFRGANALNIQGTGLGLHIVSRYAELMNGRINYRTELDKGTEFMITFSFK